MKIENINSGNFTEPINWMAPTAAKDSFAQTKRTFALYRADMAQVDPVNVDEKPISQRMQYTETLFFTVYYDSTINSKYQIVYNNENYNILEIEPLNLKVFMRVKAVKIEE